MRANLKYIAPLIGYQLKFLDDRLVGSMSSEALSNYTLKF